MIMKCDRLKYFYIVSQTLNLKKASEIMNISHSSLSRQITILEEELKIKLFFRNSKGLTLSPDGQKLLKRVNNISSEIDNIQNFSNSSEPSGKLRISATNAFGTLWITPRIKRFINRFPNIQIALNLRDSEPKVLHYASDIEIRMTESTSQDDIQIKISQFEYKIYASKQYIEENGFPNSINDLDNHKIIAYGETAQPPLDRTRLNWLLHIGRGKNNIRKPILEISNIHGIVQATESSIGISSLPSWMEEVIKLEEILCQLEGPKLNISICYKYDLKEDPRIRVFKDFLFEEVKYSNT